MKKYLNLLNLLFLSLIFSISTLDADASISLAQKEKKIYPMGKKIYEKRCKTNIDLQKYKSIDALSKDIKDKDLCRSLNKKQLDALCLYLFEVKRVSSGEAKVYEIKASKDEKCPICGMYVHKYPKWICQIFYDDKHLSFDGVKDMMKYYFSHKKGISKMLVRDYYSQKVLDARDAYFVVGSDVYGPMGNELIVFKKESEAKTFSMDHKGIKVMKFRDIDEEEIDKLDR